MRLQVPAPARILYEPARYKGLHGGRGSAKSTSMADGLIVKGLQAPTRWLCAREIQKSLRASVYQLLMDRIEAHGLRDAYYGTERGIFGPNGTMFLFAGLRTNPESVKSMEGLDGAWVEEADRCAQKSLDLLTPTLRKENSEAWFSWNRRSVKDPVDAMFLGGKPPPNSLVAQMNWRDNPFFPEVLRAEMEWLKDRDRDKWLHVWEGHPLQRTEAKVFPQFRVEDMDDEVPATAIARYGADWGMRDPTVLVKLYVLGRTLYIAREVYKVGTTIDETPALFAGSDFQKPERWKNVWAHPGMPDIMQARIVADSAYPQTIRYLNDRGFTVKGAVKGPGSVEEGVEFIKSFDIVVHPSCIHCIDELGYYQYKEDPQTEEILPELKDKDNHVIDSIRYGLEGDRKAKRRKGISTNTQVVNL
jgi:phage terminase large subunit